MKWMKVFLVRTTNLDGKFDWPWTTRYLRTAARLARLDLRESEWTTYYPISNGYRAMGPPATRYHQQLWNNGTLARVKVLPFPRLPVISLLHELMVGGDVREVFWMLEVRLRECLDLLVRGSMGHRIKVVHLWHLRLIVTRLKERERKI